MFKDTRTYTDFNGVERTESFYFHLSTPELIEMQVNSKEGYDQYVDRIMKSKDYSELVKVFKEIILKSYGKKSEDGRSFRKSEEITEDFKGTQAYCDLYMQLATDAEFAAKFMNGIIPSNFKEEVNKFKSQEIKFENLD